MSLSSHLSGCRTTALTCHIILGGWAGGPDAQCVTRVLSSTSGPGFAEFLGPGLPFLGLPWEKMPLLLEGGGCGGEG